MISPYKVRISTSSVEVVAIALKLVTRCGKAWELQKKGNDDIP
jgi:hypothetical protein